jgi:hypothetical protein
MSTPVTSDHGADARARQEQLTQTIGAQVAAPGTEAKAPWWKRLLGRG